MVIGALGTQIFGLKNGLLFYTYKWNFVPDSLAEVVEYEADNSKHLEGIVVE